MKIFLTGGTGFVGSHLLRLLGCTNHSVTALCRSASQPCIDIGKQPLWLHKEMNKLEVSDFSGVDVLVHLASVGVSPKIASWHELFYWNVLVMLELMEKAREAGVRRFVLAGSFAEYGRSADNFDFIPVDAPLLPTSSYAASKAAGFTAAYAYAIQKQIELCYLRIFSAYGEGQSESNFWPSLRAAALSGQDYQMTPGAQIRDFVPVDRVAQALLRSFESADIVTATQPYVANVASGQPVSLLDFALKFWAEWGAKGKIIVGAKPYRPNEPMRYVPLVSSEAD
jgi:nucleoside-diphosphate-sugar epimerase